jgi:4-hydroxybenzoate polyprenyltransferase
MLRSEVEVLEQLRSSPVASIGSAGSARALLAALRPVQWTKNGLVFVALAFSLNLLDTALVVRSLAAFACLCAASSAGYLLNDLSDVDADRLHPVKSGRPIASGAVPFPLAIVLMIALATGAVVGGLAISRSLGLLVIAYLGLTTAYTRWLKHMLLIDIFAIAALFVLRAAAGGAAIDVAISPWLYLATLLGALLIALGKRRAELHVLGTGAAAHRRNLQAYSVEFIDQLTLMVSSATLMTYALYTFSAETLPKSHSMMLTIPVVLYGLFRYMFLARSGDAGGAPEDLLFKDRPLLITVAVWAVLSVTILYVGALV